MACTSRQRSTRPHQGHPRAATITPPSHAVEDERSAARRVGLRAAMHFAEHSGEPATRHMTLDAEDIESIATRVVELLRGELPSSAIRLADAAEVARELGVDRDWVYAHARELGATRLGSGRGRWRFDLARIRRDLASASASTSRSATTRRPRRQPKERRSEVDLLPYSEVRCAGQKRSGRAARERPPARQREVESRCTHTVEPQRGSVSDGTARYR
jgi:hypothetical protein